MALFSGLLTTHYMLFLIDQLLRLHWLVFADCHLMTKLRLFTVFLSLYQRVVNALIEDLYAMHVKKMLD